MAGASRPSLSVRGRDTGANSEPTSAVQTATAGAACALANGHGRAWVMAWVRACCAQLRRRRNARPEGSGAVIDAGESRGVWRLAV